MKEWKEQFLGFKGRKTYVWVKRRNSLLEADRRDYAVGGKEGKCWEGRKNFVNNKLTTKLISGKQHQKGSEGKVCYEEKEEYFIAKGRQC